MRLIPIHEYNPCHRPKGPGGGQFCGDDAKAEVQRLKQQWEEEDRKVVGHIEPEWEPPERDRWPQNPRGWVHWAGGWVKHETGPAPRRKRKREK